MLSNGNLTSLPITAPKGYEIVRRHFTADSVNTVANDPSVFPWMGPINDKPLDFDQVVSDRNNVLLMGEYGGVLFYRYQPGLYEAHTQVLPGGRGPWTVHMVREALRWMFTRTDALEIVTRVPYGNIAARALVRSIHGVFEFRREQAWAKDGKPISADIFALRIQDWMRTAPELVERGRWFHHRLHEEYKKFGKTETSHGEDENHDRYVGGAVEMMVSGQAYKGAILYNRWANICGFQPVSVMNLAPLTINIQEAVLVVRDQDFWVVSCPGQ